MAIQCQIQITPSKIRLQIPERNVLIQEDNVVTYDRNRVQMLSVGDNEATLKAQFGKEWNSVRSKTAFTRLFDPETTGPIFDYVGLEYILEKARSTAYGKWSPLISLLTRLDFVFSIQGYEKLTLGRRLELEYYMQGAQRARQLTINGNDVAIPTNMRNLEFFLRAVFISLIPAILIYGGMMIAFRMEDFGWETVMLYMIGFILAAIAVYLISTIIWMVTMKRFLPASFLRYQLRNTRPALRKIIGWLAQRFL